MQQVVDPVLAAAPVVALAAIAVALIEHLSRRTLRTENVRLAEAVRQSTLIEQRAHAIQTAGQISLCDIDLASDEAYVSPAMCAVLGVPSGEALANASVVLASAVHVEDLSEVEVAIDASKRGDSATVMARVKDLEHDAHRWHRVFVAGAVDAAGRATRRIVVTQDIDDLVRSMESANQASSLKSQFLANMSHELRTPMNGVIGMAQLLQRSELDPKQRRYADTILNSARSLLSIINDILDLSKIESGMLRLDPDWVGLDQLAHAALGVVEGVALQKGVALELELPPRADQTLLYCDADRVRQVLVNLLGNALKFSDEGVVRLGMEHVGRAGWKFAVTDNGPGIPPDQQAQIFERFRQVDGSSTRRHGGTGLGLAICSELVSIMKGAIDVESVPGHGSTFWFVLPLESRRAAEANQSKTDPIRRGDDLAGARVLLVEDNETNRLLMREVLHEAGVVQLTEAENGADAIECLEAAHYDLVLMDIHMPVMPGDVAIRTIRASNAPYASVPIMVVTASAMKGQRDAYLATGADEYVAKPLDLAEFEHKARALLAAGVERRGKCARA
ncbi:MAG TPA: ATP-binding protein [Vitreimonas sp.]|uniref:ATP-binding protein n=1 Tax=Vitreimonas sp. TaxID=3069702 RepID=UPI002D3F727B|nr:ATP-binding protein [Vitreimonas sp.]HYD86740.1 ATP-binding protein [Vitreimonas sp.]